jgi:acetyl esterase/lipase
MIRARFAALLLASLAAAPALAAAPSPAAVARTEPRVVKDDAYPQVKVKFPHGVTGLPGLTYSQPLGFRPLKLDLYLPPKRFKGPRPTIVYVHGGSWLTGNPRLSGGFANWPEVLAAFAARGYVVAAVSYRFAGEEPFPAAIHDVKQSVRWLRAHAGQYRVDKDRVLVFGVSSGGELAALADVSCGVEALEPPPEKGQPPQSGCVQGAVSWYGGFDFAEDLAERQAMLAPGASQRIESPYVGCSPCTAEQLAAPSATPYVDASDPPMLLVHGADDHSTAAAQSERFHERLQAAGARSELVILPGIGHSLLGPDAETTHAAGVQALERTTAFIDSVIGDRR